MSPMPVGDTERRIEQLAAADGLRFERNVVPAITQRGHLDLRDVAPETVSLLRGIYLDLGGNEDELAAKRPTPLRGDFLHVATRTVVEIDELQHFTTARRRTLVAYPPQLSLGFDLNEYLQLCDEWSSRADLQYAHRPAVGFGPGGRQRQRAYNDALRDIALPALGYAPVVRIATPDRDGETAYARVRAELLSRTTTRTPLHPEEQNDER
nr:MULTISPECIES: hypothetical protein [unclassified Curtobacterium]